MKLFLIFVDEEESNDVFFEAFRNYGNAKSRLAILKDEPEGYQYYILEINTED